MEPEEGAGESQRCQCPQVAACVLGVVTIALSVGMYIQSDESVTISIDLENVTAFNAWLTLCMLLQIFTCDVYLVGAMDATPGWACGGVSSSLVGLVGWGTLASFTWETPPHNYGVALYMAGTSGMYICMLGASAPKEMHQAVTLGFALAFVGAGAQGIAFLVCEFGGDHITAVPLEWGSFLCMDVLFVLFFATHGFHLSRGDSATYVALTGVRYRPLFSASNE